MIEVTMDQSGKVEVPEDIRRCLRLNPGSKLEIGMSRVGEIRLYPLAENGDNTDSQCDERATQSPRLVRENGVLVVETGPIDDFVQYYLEHAVEIDREERMRKVMGDILS